MAVEGGEQLLHGEFVVADVVPDVEMSKTEWRVAAILGKLLAGLPDGATVFRTARADDDIGISTRGEVFGEHPGYVAGSEYGYLHRTTRGCGGSEDSKAVMGRINGRDIFFALELRRLAEPVDESAERLCLSGVLSAGEDKHCSVHNRNLFCAV